MKAIILVGGQGSRLLPITCKTPKAMVPILNRPFLEHLLLYLKKFGVTEVIFAIGHLADTIQHGFGNGFGCDIRLSYSVERSAMGTAGAVKYAETFLNDEPFFVLNGDSITDIDLNDMLKRHRETQPMITIALTPVDDPSAYGVVDMDDQGLVRHFVEKPLHGVKTTNMINAGIYILEPEVLHYIPVSTFCMFENHLFPKILNEGKPILGYSSRAYWIDMGRQRIIYKSNLIYYLSKPRK